MKNYRYLFFILLVLAGFCFSAFAQTVNISPPDIDITFDKEPVVVKQVQPVYPASMLEGGWEATVYVKAFITIDGAVADTRSEKVQIKAIRTGENETSQQEKQTDGKAFEESALAAVHKWKFFPAQMQGKPVAVWVTIPFKFKLSGEEKKTSTKDSDDAAMEKSIESIKTVIENILKGKEIEDAKKYIGKNTSLIYNTKTVNLLSVLNGEQKDVHLTEGKKIHQRVNFNIKITDQGSSALIVLNSELLKGKNKRVHSIFLSRDQSKEWKITHWHVSF